jgi:hypothetical protein
MRKSELYEFVLDRARYVSASNMGDSSAFYTILSLRAVIQWFFGEESEEFKVIDGYCRTDSHTASYHFCGPVRPDASATV